MKRDLYICRTYYNVLISALKTLVLNKKADIILDDYNEKNFSNLQSLKSSLIKSGIFYEVIIFEGGASRNILSNNLGKRRSKKIIQRIKNIEVPIYINDNKYNNIYIYNDWDGVLGKFLRYKHKKYILSEPSKNAFQVMYQTTPGTFVYKTNINFFKRIEGCLYSDVDIPVGHSKYCAHIELSSVENVPKYVKKKAKIVNVDLLFDSLKVEQRKLLKEIFCANLKFEWDNAHEKILILTRPYASSDKWLPSEEVQEKMILDIVLHYTEEGCIYIKPHPRDMCNYGRIAKECSVKIIPKEFPVEILNFYEEMYFKKVISIGENCAKNLKCADSFIELDLEWFKKVRADYCTAEEIKLLNPL